MLGCHDRISCISFLGCSVSCYVLHVPTSCGCSLQVYVVGGNKPEDAVRQWHRSSGSVLICTHEKFRDTGQSRLLQVAGVACAFCLHSLNFAADSPTCVMHAVLGLAVGRPKASGNLDARHSTASAQPRAAAVLNEPLAAAAAHATQSSPEPSLAEMLQKGAEVVVVDEAHVLKNDTVSGRPYSSFLL